MRAWPSFTCAHTPSFPSSTAPCGSTTWSPPPRPTARARVAITDLSNLFGAVKLYIAARKAGVKPIIGADVWLEPDGGDKQPSRLLLLVQTRAGYANLCTLLSRAWTEPQPRAPGLAASGAGWPNAATGLIALSGADLGAVGQALLARDGRAPRRLAQRLAALFPQRFYIELQRAGGADERGPCARRRAAGGRARACRWSPRIRCSSCTPTTSRRTRRGSASPRARRWPTRGASSASTPSSISRPRRRWRQRFADLPSALRNSVEIARRCNLTLVLGQPQLPGLPDPARRRRAARRPRPTSAICRTAAWSSGSSSSTPTPRSASASAPRYVERLDFEIETILKMGFPGLLPDRRRLHRLGAQQRLPGRPRPRLGRGLAGRLCAAHHRPRPAALQPAVRALPQSGPGLDARLRHRLLPGQPRPRDRLREAEVRPRCGEPDRHLRHHGRQGRAARRGPRARHELRPCRQRGQADPVAARQGGHAGARARASPTAA